MKKLIFLIVVFIVCFWGWQQYANRKTKSIADMQTTIFNTNSETANIGNVTIHCLSSADVDSITARDFILQNEVYTSSVQLLECSYQESNKISNIYPTIKYKEQLSNDANTLWTRKKNSLQSAATFRSNSDFPTIFASINPVKEFDQATFYGKNDQGYFELTYTPVAEGQTLLLEHGFSLLQKALNN